MQITKEALVRALLAVVVAALAVGAGAARSGEAPSWTLQLRVDRWVAPSSFAATVTGQVAGLHVRRGLRVTLRLDRRTRCARRDTGGAVTAIRCAAIRPLLSGGPLQATATGQFETGHLGSIAFRARALTLR